MKKTISFLIMLCLLAIVFVMPTFAATEYTFKLEYTGDLIVNKEIPTNVVLEGISGQKYTNVRIDVKVTGPSTPKLIATDANGTQIDIAQVGYWGPVAGFPVEGTFTNTTPVKATFTQAGEYKITLTLVNVANNNSEITKNEFTVNVVEDQTTPPNNESAPDDTQKPVTPPTETPGDETTEVEEIPKTGIGITEYMVYFLIAGGILFFGYRMIQSKK